jgi:acyl carrier protein
MEKKYSLDDLHTLLGIYIAIENWFNIKISDTEISEVETIDELVELVDRKRRT